MTFLRTAEMMYSWTLWDSDSELDVMLEQARRDLSLFQHHDGITGTAKDHVVKDYAAKMMNALKNCKFVIQQAAYRLLTKPSVSYFFLYLILALFKSMRFENLNLTVGNLHAKL